MDAVLARRWTRQEYDKMVAAEARFDWHRGIILAMLRHPRLSGLLLRKAVFTT